MGGWIKLFKRSFLIRIPFIIFFQGTSLQKMILRCGTLINNNLCRPVLHHRLVNILLNSSAMEWHTFNQKVFGFLRKLQLFLLELSYWIAVTLTKAIPAQRATCTHSWIFLLLPESILTKENPILKLCIKVGGWKYLFHDKNQNQKYHSIWCLH